MRPLLALSMILLASQVQAQSCDQALVVAEAYRTAALTATRGARATARTYPDCPRLGAGRADWRDARGTLRRTVLDLGGDDSTLRTELFRDTEGRPRLAIITGGAVSGARLLHRIALRPDGTRICESRSVSAPGYTFPNPIPDAMLPHPTQAAGRCPWPDESPP